MVIFATVEQKSDESVIYKSNDVTLTHLRLFNKELYEGLMYTLDTYNIEDLFGDIQFFSSDSFELVVIYGQCGSVTLNQGELENVCRTIQNYLVSYTTESTEKYVKKLLYEPAKYKDVIYS